MGFIEFPFIEVSKDLRKIVGEPTPGTRAYRREGAHAECGQWIEDLGLHYKGDVGISPAGVTMFVPVQRAAVHKRIKEGKLTAFFFYITHRRTGLPPATFKLANCSQSVCWNFSACAASFCAWVLRGTFKTPPNFPSQ